MRKLVALVAVAALVAFAAPAFAANPFMDVPMNHWAYDAVSQLAARGIVTGYPDGAFKGQWKATRYEMASVVARALAYVDMNKASKEDLELLKKLVVEFKDELDALGVKVEDLDKRVGVLESDIGGWKFWGQLRFDAKWADVGSTYGLTGDTDFTMSRYRIWMRKKVDDKVTFYARLGGEDATFERYYVSVAFPWDATAWVGKWNYDWEGEDGFYNDNDAWFTDQTPNGFYLTKPFSMGQFDAFVTHAE
ncbi:MAG: S-layer homology domain-containing protein, partial [Thermovirga sp.]|nr:S-layer homology domain-containing protein [Thermovirga sp.]